MTPAAPATTSLPCAHRQFDVSTVVGPATTAPESVNILLKVAEPPSNANTPPDWTAIKPAFSVPPFSRQAPKPEIVNALVTLLTPPVCKCSAGPVAPMNSEPLVKVLADWESSTSWPPAYCYEVDREGVGLRVVGCRRN